MKRVDLPLPKSYAQCDIHQLRALMALLTDASKRIGLSQLRKFDNLEYKMAAFFRLARLEVVEPADETKPIDKQHYICRLIPYTIAEERKWHGLYHRMRRLYSWLRRKVLGDDDTFPLYVWQINYWLLSVDGRGKKKVGVFDWIVSQSTDLYAYPLETMRLRHGLHRETFRCPPPLMDGFSWHRYRMAQDYMEMYVNRSNRLLQLQRRGAKVTRREVEQAIKDVDIARAMFLATVFERKIDYTDETGIKRHGFRYHKEQVSDTMTFFRSFPDTDWQIMLVWWSSQMQYLSRTYPKVFKRQATANKRSNPLEIYTRTTATIEKYLHITAEEVDNEPYTTIIQQLQDMILRNEEMERINKKSGKN